MLPENKQNRRYKQINFISHQNNRHPSQPTVAAIKDRVTEVLQSIPKEAFADSFKKLYERCQPCVVKDDDYFEGQ
jgi:hypothetical protein